MAKKVIRLTEQDVERLVKKIIKEGSSKEDLLVRAYNVISMIGYTDEEIEELSEEFNDDLSKVYNFLVKQTKRKYDAQTLHELKHILYDLEKNVGGFRADVSDNTPRGVDHMDDDLGWAEESVEDGNGFDWLYNEPPSRMVGMVFDWDGNIYEVIDAFDASEPDEMGEPFYGEYGEPEEGIWFWAIDPETGEEYDEAIPMDAVIAELESGIATLISYGGKNYN